MSSLSSTRCRLVLVQPVSFRSRPLEYILPLDMVSFSNVSKKAYTFGYNFDNSAIRLPLVRPIARALIHPWDR